MTDPELQGIAAQAFNLARRDLEQKASSFSFLLAAYFAGDGLHRMEKIEKQIFRQFGRDWLNSGKGKDVVFGNLRAAFRMFPPDGLVFVSVINKFEPTPKVLASPELMRKIAEAGSHDTHHEFVKQGLLTVHDALACVAQTRERVCLYVRRFDQEGPPETHFFDQANFDGRMKMYGTEAKPVWRK